MSLEYEAKQTARAAGISPRAWRRLLVSDQADLIALRRIESKMASVERQERAKK